MTKMKRIFAIIITLILVMLPMMTTPIQAATLGRVYGLTSEMQGNTVYLGWDSVANADGYDIYINTSNRGYEYIGSVSGTTVGIIGFQENEDYEAKVRAYQMQNGSKITGSFSSETKVDTTAKTTLKKVSALSVSQNGGNVTLNWSSVTGADGYQVFVNIPNFGFMNVGTVNTTTCIIQGFQNKQTYQFKVRAYETLSTGTLNYGDYSPTKTLYMNDDIYDDENPDIEETKPGRVTGLTIDDIYKNQVDISWSEATDADGYEIWLAKGNGNYQYKDSLTKTYATLKNLDYGANYRVKIIAYREGNNGTIYGEESSYRSFSIEEQEVELDPVENFDVEVDGNKAYIDWSRVPNADGYEIWLKRENGSYQHKKDTTSTSATISNLDYDTTYRVKIMPYIQENGNKQYGEYSDERRFTTDEEEITLAKVTGVESEVYGNEVDLSWDRVSNADGYNIYLSKNNGSYRYEKTTSARSTTITGLEYDTTYRVKIYAYRNTNKGEIEGPASSIERFTTDEKETANIGQVTHLNAEVQNRNEAYLTWWPVEGAYAYEVYLSEDGGAYRKVVDLLDNHTILYSSLLDYNTNYRVKVVAYKWVNGKQVYGKESTSVAFKTERRSTTEGNSSVPRVTGLRANVVGDTVYLSWTPVSGAVKYEIDFTVPGIGGSVKMTEYSTSRTISGLTDKKYNYTARVRAYKYVNGRLVAGEYSYIQEFTGK